MRAVREKYINFLRNIKTLNKCKDTLLSKTQSFNMLMMTIFQK